MLYLCLCFCVFHVFSFQHDEIVLSLVLRRICWIMCRGWSESAWSQVETLSHPYGPTPPCYAALEWLTLGICPLLLCPSPFVEVHLEVVWLLGGVVSCFMLKEGMQQSGRNMWGAPSEKRLRWFMSCWSWGGSSSCQTSTWSCPYPWTPDVGQWVVQ